MPGQQISYIQHLSSDPFMQRLLADAEPRELKRIDNFTFFLYSTIVKQQLSTKVGEVLLKRFLGLYNGVEPTAEEVIATPLEDLKALGLSKSKASFIKNVAQFDLEHGINAEKLDSKSDEKVIKYITGIKGIGLWTAHLFLMAALGREDVFPADDLILQKAVAGIYGLDRTDKKKFMADMLSISEKWSPYRTYASMHLWRWKRE